MNKELAAPIAWLNEINSELKFLFNLRKAQIRMLMTMHSFRSLQSDASLMAKESRLDLLAGAVQCWQGYPLAKMESVWLCPYSSFREVLESEDKTRES